MLYLDVIFRLFAVVDLLPSFCISRIIGFIDFVIFRVCKCARVRLVCVGVCVLFSIAAIVPRMLFRLKLIVVRYSEYGKYASREFQIISIERIVYLE